MIYIFFGRTSYPYVMALGTVTPATVTSVTTATVTSSTMRTSVANPEAARAPAISTTESSSNAVAYSNSAIDAGT